MRRLIVILVLLCATPLRAQEPMSAAEFQAFVEGRTLYFGQHGQAYGAEEYLPNRRVRWSFLDGDCKEGFWYAEAGEICFIYEDTPEPQCWSFFRDGDRLRAVFESNPESTVLYSAEQTDEAMLCRGPRIGV